MKFLRAFLKWFLVLLVLLNAAILFSGKAYLYKGMADTYLKGRTGPSIDEYAIFDNNIVETGTPEKWSTAKDYNTKKIPDSLRKHFEEMKTAAFLVIQNDSIRYEEYWDGFSDTSHTNSWSMAKTIVSLLIGIAIDEGKIKSMDQPVSDFIPELKEGLNGKMTVRHLLSMSSGMSYDEHYKDPFSYTAEALYGNNLVKLTMKYHVMREPGKVFEYRSGNTVLLGMILKKATGMTVSRYASEKLWKKIGAEHPAFWCMDHAGGIEKTYCCFNSNARDFARIGKLGLDSGRWNGKQLVSEKYFLESIRPADLVESDGTRNQRYGLSWWIIPNYNGHSVFYARGILGQYVVVIPDKKMIIVRLGRKRELDRGTGYPADLGWYIDAGLQLCNR